jgi:hypothetical protein
VRTTRFWNSGHQVRSKSKDWKIYFTLGIMYQFLNIAQLFVSFEVLTEGLLGRVVKGIDCLS